MEARGCTGQINITSGELRGPTRHFRGRLEVEVGVGEGGGIRVVGGEVDVGKLEEVGGGGGMEGR